MANSDATSSVSITSDNISTKKENIVPVNSKIEELSESRLELQNRIQSLKKDLQGWRSKLDTQVKVYRDELSELKKSLNVEVEQLRTEFQDLRTTLQQQQDDVTASLRNLGLHDNREEAKEADDGDKLESIDEKLDNSCDDKSENIES